MKKREQLKRMLKTWAGEIRRLKALRKGSPYGRVSGLEPLRYKYRHYHIASCELRGTPREKIERKTNSAPNNKHIEEIKKKYQEVSNEAVCGS
jgi:hypothetical protein